MFLLLGKRSCVGRVLAVAQGYFFGLLNSQKKFVDFVNRGGAVTFFSGNGGSKFRKKFGILGETAD